MSEKQHYRIIALWLGLVGGPGCLSACGDTTSVDPESEPCSESEPTEGAVCVRQVTGRLLDTDGEPPPDDSLVTVCGPTCFASATEADGSFTVSVDAYLVLDEYSTLLHGAPTYSGFYFAIPGDAEGPDLDVGELTLFRLPEEGPRIPDTVTEPLELESDGVTLRLPAGLETKFEVAAFGEGELGKQFRAVEIGAEDGARVTGDLEGVFAYYAFDPFESFFIEAGDETRERVKLGMSFPNSSDLEPDAPVEVLALGSYLYQDYLTPARFDVIGEARVAPDGATIELEESQGIELLTWVALRSMQ